jgi:hypothetical protein
MKKYNLVEVIDNNEKILADGKTHKEKTLEMIESLIGSYDDFCTSSLSFQSNVSYDLDFYKNDISTKKSIFK